MSVDLEPDGLLGKSQAMQQARVLLGREHVPTMRFAAQRGTKRLLRRRPCRPPGGMAWPKLSGTWNASWPAGLEGAWSDARGATDDPAPSGAQRWRRPGRRRHRRERTRPDRLARIAGPRRRRGCAFSSIASDESIPSVSAAPVRRCSSSVSSPVPQPRSTARPPGIGVTSASRSKNGRLRSSAKRE